MELLREINEAANKTDVIMRNMEFSVYPKETRVISQRLQKRGLKPTLTNIKKHLISFLLGPLDEVPEPERAIIIRSGRTDSSGSRIFRSAAHHPR